MLFLREICETSSVLKVILFVKELMKYVFILVPIILIVMICVDFAKNVIAGREDDMKKNLNVAIKRIIMVVFMFFIPTIVNVAISLLDDYNIDYSLCFENANSEFIVLAEFEEEAYKKYEELQRKKVTVNDFGSHYVYVPGTISSSGGEDLVAVALNETINNPKGGEKYLNYFNASSNDAYCSEFVSWCANESGLVEAGIIPKYDQASIGMDWFKDRNQYKENGYCPSVGDIIFFDYNNRDGVVDHTGIVVSCDGEKVYTVEGNVGGVNKKKTYEINDYKILGYGVPKY